MPMLVLAIAIEGSILHRQPVSLKWSSLGWQQTTVYLLEPERRLRLNENPYVPLSFTKVLGTCVIVPITQMSSMKLLGVSEPGQEVTNWGSDHPPGEGPIDHAGKVIGPWISSVHPEPPPPSLF